ncbi:NAD(P)-binding protein [Aspergillus alliaceus]|uniref:NAD(P)-binding protein n=1 Tax=Petromyces alliaceus TaxID=209559 RepID=A0A5N7CCV0_PETAA|nr:NAD(P)-binding protein [Aspergillus alliaceus]
MTCLTGASGYLGGDILAALHAKHPEYKIAVLVRDADKGAKISQAYPKVHVVQGELDSVAVEEEAQKADVVVTEMIYRGLTGSERTKPGYWIQVSGATLLSAPEIEKGIFGEPTDKVYNDIDDEQEIKALIHKYSAKRVIDYFILNLPQAPQSPKTAVVYPPVIHGCGRGPIKQRSVQIPELSRITLQNKTGYRVGRGLSTWSNVHVSDVTQIFMILVEKAVAGKEGLFWNEDGIYFVENGAINFGDIGRLVAEEAAKLGLLSSASVKEISYSEADALSGHGGMLGWTPTGKSLQDEIAETVRAEAVSLGLLSA